MSRTASRTLRCAISALPSRKRGHDLRERATARLAKLQKQGQTGAYLYGEDEKVLGGLNSFYLLVDSPEVYGLPANPRLPSRNLVASSLFSGIGAVLVGLVGLLSFRQRRMEGMEEGRHRV